MTSPEVSPPVPAGALALRRPIVTSRTLALWFAATLLAACVPPSPAIDGGQAVAPSASTYWTPAAGAVPPPAAKPAPRMTPGVLDHLTLPDMVDIALTNNPATTLAWSEAKASAYDYAATQGRRYPSVSVGASLTNSGSNTSNSGNAAFGGGASGSNRTSFGPSVDLSYLVLDFGGRAGSIEAARASAVAADYAHNVAIQTTILTVESAVYGYLATRGLRDADSVSVAEADTSLQAARERYRVGVAAISDTLQAKSALAQAQLALETLEGSLEVAHGQVAAALGLPTTAKFEVPGVGTALAGGASDSVQFVAQSVDSLIEAAERLRPDLAAARADAQQALADIQVTRSAGLPSLAFTGTGGYTVVTPSSLSHGSSYTLGLGLSWPLFTGFSQQDEERAAAAQLDAANARTEQSRQQIDLGVVAGYYGMQTATRLANTSRELLAAATLSEDVALGRYREGVGNIVDLLTAQAALASARAYDVQSHWQWRESLAQLAYDVGLLGIHGETPLPLTARPPERP